MVHTPKKILGEKKKKDVAKVMDGISLPRLGYKTSGTSVWGIFSLSLAHSEESQLSCSELLHGEAHTARS